MSVDTYSGSCLCGAVGFEVRGKLRPVVACHCLQCRKQTGTYMSSTACKDDQLTLTGTDADPQHRAGCATMLSDVGASVFLSNAAATRHALELLGSTR